MTPSLSGLETAAAYFMYRSQRNSQPVNNTVSNSHYFIGDLGYVMTNQEWAEMFDLSFPDPNSGKEVEGLFKLKDGREYFQFSAYFGDGTYSDNFNKRYAVDSGSIGAIRVNDISDLDNLNDVVNKGLGEIHFISEGLSASNCESIKGELHFGPVVIDTGLK